VVAEGGRNGALRCTGTFGLEGGELSVVASVSADSKVTRIPIVGGTGTYEAARGSIISVERGPNSPYSDDTIHLLAG
jgi:hypothetical protein